MFGSNDIFGFGGYFYLLYISTMTTSILASLIYFFPFIQLLVTNEKRTWLKRYFKDNPSTGQEEDQFRAKMLAAATPEQPYPVYKLLKFYLVSLGIFGMVAGFLIIVLPERTGSDLAEKILILVPALVGIGLYSLYKKFNKGHGLWREIAGFFLLVGVAVTLIGAYDIYELDDWLRSDILVYILLGFGLFVMHHLNSKAASIAYLALIVFSANFISSGIGYNWMLFFTHFIWLFAFAVLSFWKPKFERARQIEFGHVIFGIFFMMALFSLATNQTAGLSHLAFAVILPYLYFFSKVNYQIATWVGGRIIEVAIVLMVLGGSIAFSFEQTVRFTARQIDLFDDFSFYRIVAFLIIFIIGFMAYINYANLPDSEKKDINIPIVFGPLGSFLAIYFLYDFGAHYLINAFLLVLGITYLRRGLARKDAIRLIVGTIGFLAAIFVRVYGIIEDLDDKFLVGLTILVIGMIVFGLAMYMRNGWTVSAPDSRIDD